MKSFGLVFVIIFGLIVVATAGGMYSAVETGNIVIDVFRKPVDVLSEAWEKIQDLSNPNAWLTSVIGEKGWLTNYVPILEGTDGITPHKSYVNQDMYDFYTYEYKQKNIKYISCLWYLAKWNVAQFFNSWYPGIDLIPSTGNPFYNDYITYYA